MHLDLDQSRRVKAADFRTARAARVSVLIADDHSGFRCALECLLRSCGELILVGSARSGEEAIQLAADLRPRVLVMDLGMPGLGGVAATRHIRAQRFAPAVVALSGSRALMREAVAAGAAYTVLKDEDPQRLLNVIHAAGT
jgi:DNA-binding NarL/FixJ family response regulator